MPTIFQIPAFSDNYIWCIQAADGNRVALVDPGDTRVLEVLRQRQLQPLALLITHQHVDHVAAVQALLERYPDLRVYGPAQAQVSARRFGPEMPITHLINHPLKEGDAVDLAEVGARFQAIELPGHTLDHIGYFGEGVLFCGDTLFGCGCGRIMGGDAQSFSRSLKKIAALPADTQMYCAHEYTLDNIGFAKWLEPDNTDLLQRDEQDMARQEKGIPTVPSSLQLELKTNPFLRYREPQVKQAVEEYLGRVLNTDAEVFGAIRAWKDREYD
jgi:hydroxyacylglutathione hydrolase